MKISSGILIIFNNKFLLCHPTNLSWVNSFTMPKGGVDEGESFVDGAIRETKEEVGIDINKSQISNINNPIEIKYINKKDILFKKVYVFIVRINSLSEIGLGSEIINKNQLQLSEIDYASFLTKEEALNKIFFRFKNLLDINEL